MCCSPEGGFRRRVAGMIEPRGGKHAYVICGAAIRYDPGTTYIRHRMTWTAADSEDEAYGIGMRVMLAAYPVNDGWQAHDIQLRRVDDIAWVGRVDMATVEAVEV